MWLPWCYLHTVRVFHTKYFQFDVNRFSAFNTTFTGNVETHSINISKVVCASHVLNSTKHSKTWSADGHIDTLYVWMPSMVEPEQPNQSSNDRNNLRFYFLSIIFWVRLCLLSVPVECVYKVCLWSVPTECAYGVSLLLNSVEWRLSTLWR